ncbi:MAG: hypothetical protein MUF84_12060 [Anaerolineae bacterium]|jgi:hypothetical protein|nr:hypothetical protein [Anaerolineae bacterium]
MATWYVNTDNTGTKDGTTFPNGYDNLQDCISAKAGVLSEPMIVYCGGATADTLPVNITGYTTTSGNYIDIRAHTGYQHAGVWDNSKYHLVSPSLDALTLQADYTRIDGLQITCDTIGADSKYQIYNPNTATGCRISNCIIKHHGNATYPQSGLYHAGSSKTMTVWNCVFMGMIGTYAIRVDNYGGEVLNLYNCTIIGSSTYGVRGGSGTTINAVNCYAGGFGTCFSSGGTINLTTCGASDTTGTSSALDSIAVSETADATHAGFTSIGSGTENYTLKVGSALIGAGTSDPGSGLYSTDIAGTTRS